MVSVRRSRKVSYLLVIALVGILLVQLSDQLVAAAIANCLRLPGEDTSLSSLCCAFALELEAENPRVALARGVRLAQAGRFSEAEPFLRRAYVAQPSDVTAFFWAQTLGASGRFQEMALLFEGSRHAGTKDKSILFHARYHGARGAWTLAQALYEQAIAQQLLVGPPPDWMRAEAGWLLVRHLQTELDSAAPSEEGYRRYRLGRAYARIGLWEQAIAEFQKTQPELTAEPTDGVTELGTAYAATGDVVRAIETLEDAYQSGNRSPQLMLTLAKLWREQGLAANADALEAEFRTLGPRYVINKATTPEWFLWGYDLDELELEEGPEVTLYLYWRRDDGRYDSCLIVESYRALNLAFDGSFEWSAMDEPSGSQTSPEPGRGCSPFVVRGERSGSVSGVLYIPRVTEGNALSISGCHSHKASVESGATYLLRGLIAGQGQSVASFGLIWGTPGRPGFPSEGSHYAAQGPVAEWREYHTITTAPQEATFGFVRMMHQQTAGWVAYDNVLFARIPQEPGKPQDGEQHLP